MNLNSVSVEDQGFMDLLLSRVSASSRGENLFLFDPILEKEDRFEKEERDEERV